MGKSDDLNKPLKHWPLHCEETDWQMLTVWPRSVVLLVRSGLGLMRRTCSRVGLPASLVCSRVLRGELKGRPEPSADRETLRLLLRERKR